MMNTYEPTYLLCQEYNEAKERNLMELVDEWESEQAQMEYYRQMQEEYEQMIEALENPEISYAEDTPYAVIEKIETINCVLNGNDHNMKQVVRLRERGYDDIDEYTEVWYREGTLWAVNYDEDDDCWNAIRLDALSVDSLDRLASVLIDEIY